ncbi:FUSC family protein [Ferrimonas marina]|uniref:Uncharacterized membrane protein YccC n=1 Tax=Ferrimonas marina TaxID=299255 RepID=A0A1M5R4F8_9GAMM|nr:FUSC family protein [Ferrimonas marina]SHH21285.1 Uncharacterized membrane protein YccC [Ferrimonas marina]
MLATATKTAIKVALSIAISILIALSLGWEKPYWAAIVILVLATSESLSESHHKGINRMAGTVLGIILAFLLVANFAQQPLLFITALTLLAGLLRYMTGCPYYGYTFQMALTICAVVGGMGALDGANTFHMAITRVQENVLGLVVFSLVWHCLWPETAQDQFFQETQGSVAQLRSAIRRLAQGESVEPDLAQSIQARLKPLHLQLRMPLGSSFTLRYRTAHWQQLLVALESSVDSFAELAKAPSDLTAGQSIALAELDSVLAQLEAMARQPHRRSHLEPVTLTQQGEGAVAKLQQQLLQSASEFRIALGLDPSLNPPKRVPWVKYQWALNGSERLHQALTLMLIVASAMAIWVYLPIPGGVLFPVVLVSLSSVLVGFPRQALKLAFWGVTLFSVPAVLQMVLILPHLTEGWQLGLFYFANVFFIWRVFPKPEQVLLRMMGAQMLVIMTTGVMQLSPSIGVVQPLMMVLFVWLLLFIVNFFVKLMEPVAPKAVPATA